MPWVRILLACAALVWGIARCLGAGRLGAALAVLTDTGN